MVLQVSLGYIAGILVIIGYIPYTISILRRKTKPAKSTWIIWTLLSGVAALGMHASGTLNVQIVVITLGDVLIVALAFKYGAPGWSRLDLACLAGASLGIFSLIVMEDPLVALTIALGTTVIGSVPTFVKTWHYPDQENSTGYACMATSCVVQMAAIPSWTISATAQPLIYLGIAGTILVLIYTGHRRMRFQ